MSCLIEFAKINTNENLYAFRVLLFIKYLPIKKIINKLIL